MMLTVGILAVLRSQATTADDLLTSPFHLVYASAQLLLWSALLLSMSSSYDW